MPTVLTGALISPGGAQGPSGPNAVSTDAGNQATFGSDNKIYVPDPTPIITSVRLRSFNAIGNPNFECAQRNCGTAVSNPPQGTPIEDRWFAGNNGSLNPLFQKITVSPGAVVVPGTNQAITVGFMRITSQTQKTTLAATDLVYLFTTVEGPNFRELISDVHSVSLLVRSSVANLKFGLCLRDGGATRTLTKLCTLGAANTITLIQLPNLPLWDSGGSFSVAPGAAAYGLTISLAVGSTYTNTANNVWTTGNLPGAPGQDNFLANAVNSTFEVFFVQHEPGPLCTTLIDKPFMLQNYDECLRYFCKSYGYTVKPGIADFSCLTVITTINTQYGMGNILFPKVMAKNPNITLYNPSTGAANSAYGQDATSRGVSAVNSNEKQFQGLNFGSTVSAGTVMYHQFHYTADTGW